MRKLFCVAVLSMATITVAHADGNVHRHGVDQGQAASMGKPGNPAKMSRTVKVEMNDTMRFVPSTITVKRGETIRFAVTNTGKIKHELVLGSAKALKEHAELMRKFPAMEHAEPNQLDVLPGRAGELVWQFTKTGTVDFACLEPGHFEAGMRGKVTVK